MKNKVNNAVGLWKQVREAEEMIARVNTLRDDYKRAMNALNDNEMEEYLRRVKILKIPNQ